MQALHSGRFTATADTALAAAARVCAGGCRLV